MKEVKLPVYSKEGKETGTIVLDSAFFGIAFNGPLVHQVTTAQMANSRTVLAHTKTRGEVRGGGRKPWKQKGTGRARHGSIRSPLWVGGGITFGPRSDRNFSQKINKRMRRQALKMVLSDKAANGKLIVIDQWSMAEPKTKQLASIIHGLPCKGKKTLIVTIPKIDANIIQAASNIAKVSRMSVNSLNVVDTLKYEYLVMAQAVLPMIIERYGK